MDQNKQTVKTTDIATQIASVQELITDAKRLEDQYQTVKAEVSEIWKRYFPLSEEKKALNTARKAAKAKLKTALENAPELASLLDSIK
jgi:chromosome segregation ATPase